MAQDSSRASQRLGSDNPQALGHRSIGWVALETGTNALLMLGGMLIVARMVGAAEFALAALVTGGVQLVNLYVEGFFHDALIQRRDEQEDVFDHAFWAAQAVAFALLTITAVAYVFAGVAYTRVAALVVLAAASLPFSAALGVTNAWLRRTYRHRDVARASIVGRVAGIAAGAGLAALGAGGWSLVVQYTLGVVINTVVVMGLALWRPRWGCSLGRLKTLLRFAFPNAAMHTLVAVRMQAFAMLVAALGGLTSAGFLNVAFRLTSTPQMMLTVALTNLSLPALAAQQRDPVALRLAFDRVAWLVPRLTLPLFALLACSCDAVLPLLLGPQWGPSVPLVQMLCVGAMVACVRLPGAFLMRAIGRVRYAFADAALQLAATVGGMVLLRPSDPQVAVLVWIAPALLPLLVTGPVVRRETGIGLRAQFAPAFVPSLAVVAIFAADWIVRPRLVGASLLMSTLARVSIGAVAAGVMMLLADPRLRRRVLRRRPSSLQAS